MYIFFYFISILLYKPLNIIVKNNIITETFILMVNILFTIFFIRVDFIKNDSKRNRNYSILNFAYIFRIALLFIDIYLYKYIKLPNSGSDTENFYRVGKLVSNNISLIKHDIYGGAFTKIVGLLLNLTNNSRILVQYFNVILSVSTLAILYKSFKALNVNKILLRRGFMLAAFFPISMINSSILLRESIIIYYVTKYMYNFILLSKNKKNIYFLKCLLNILFASIFHAGSIGLLLGLSIVIVFWDREYDKIQFRKNKILSLALIFFLILILIKGNSIFLKKFSNVESYEDVINASNARGGGSAYLKNLKIKNSLELILFSPIFMIYFISSPMIWNIRNIYDVIAIIFDSITYMYLMTYIMFNRRDVKTNKYLFYGLYISLLAVIFIFGVSVQNTGTAIRHRNKYFNIILTLYLIVKNNKKENILNAK